PATSCTRVRFGDTNILLYAISRDPESEAKRRRANEIVFSRDIALSVQVLQELYVQATRVSRPDALSHQQAVKLVESLTRFPVLETSVALIRAAMVARESFQLSYWDAAIIEAARLLECDVVLTEDLNDGQDYDGVVVRNPFR
ncbi:MAG: PIN domain-containing protein, partial [Acidobacteriota bacterium]|nr:PIN domain-containing protein [Acidobacteriota bacterium]